MPTPNRFFHVLFALILTTICSCSSKSAIDHVNDGLEEQDLETKISHFSTAIEKDKQLDLAFALRGEAWHKLGDNSAAMKDLNRAIELADSSEYLARNSRGIVWRVLGDYRRAVDDHTRAIELNPLFAAAYAQRASDWLVLGENVKAIEDYEQAVSLEPDYDLAHIGLASIYTNSQDQHLRDAKAAIQHAETACELTGFRLPQYLLILADAHRVAGDSERADEYEAQAQRLAEEALDR